MGILIALFVLLFLLLLVSMPLIVEARMRLGVRGAVVHGKVYILGLVPIPVRLRMHLMQTPYFTLIIGKKQIPLLQKRPKRSVRDFRACGFCVLTRERRSVLRTSRRTRC